MENNLVQNINALKSLPKNWNILDFEKVISDVSSGNIKIKKSNLLPLGKYPVIDQGKDLIAGYSNDENALIKTEGQHIIFGDHTRIFKFIDFPFVMGADGTKVLKLKDENNFLKYIYYFFQTLNIPDTGYNRHFKYLKSVKIPLPPLTEQKRIAKLLDTADKLREQSKKIIEKYDELTQSLFLEMFGDVRTNSKKWKTIKFEDIISLKRGYDLPHKSRVKGDIPVIASTGIVGYHNEFKSDKCIVTGRSGSIGKVQLITEKCWILNTALYGYKTFGNNLVYLKYFVENFDLKRFSHGAGVPTLDRKLVHRELAPIPPIALQEEFAERVKLIEKQKAQAEQALQKSEELFCGLLQGCFK